MNEGRHVWGAYSAGGADSVTCSRPAAGGRFFFWDVLLGDILRVEASQLQGRGVQVSFDFFGGR